jgi:hypothetical protein
MVKLNNNTETTVCQQQSHEGMLDEVTDVFLTINEKLLRNIFICRDVHL